MTEQKPSLKTAAEHAAVRPRLRILVVDDNRDSATSMAMMLKMIGNETFTAFDGLQAVEAAATHSPEVILMDVSMPSLSGHEATRRIRDNNTTPRPFIVALSGWGREQDERQSLEAGCDCHIVKPVTLAVMQELLMRVGQSP